MNRHRYLLGGLIIFFALGLAHLVAAQEAPQKQDAPQKSEEKAKVEGRAGDTNFDLRVQGGESKQDRPQPGGQGDRSVPGPQGAEGAPGQRGPAGPSGPAGGEIMGMDPTVALLVGLGVLAVVIVAIVAASRGRE